MDKRLKVFFDKHIATLHDRTPADGFFPLSLDLGPAKDSYFTAPRHPQYLYLNNIPFENQERLEEYLREFWKDQPALLTLISELVDLAFQLKEEHKEQSAELSPFVYEMF